MEASDRTGFPCFHLCYACGLLHESPARCPNCRSKYNIDLGLEQAFHAFKEASEGAREARYARRLRATMVAASALSVAGFGLGYYEWSMNFHRIPGLMGVTLVTGLGFGFGAALTGPPVRSSGLDDRDFSTFTLWRAPPQRPPVLGEGVMLGRGRPQGAVPIESPLTGARCLGYVGAVVDGKGLTRLVAHANAPIELPGVQLPKDGAHLRVRMTEVDPEGERREAVKQWCRARGIDLVDDDYRVFEGHIPAEVPVIVAQHDPGITLEQDREPPQTGYRS